MSNVSYQMRRYESISECIDIIRQFKGTRGASVSEGESWAGTKSLDEALDFAQFGGWEPNVQTDLRGSFERVTPKLRQYVDQATVIGMGMTGATLDIQRYEMGVPECTFEMVYEPGVTQNRVMTLVIGHSISSGVTAKELFARGQAVVALIRALRMMGYELEIWSEFSVAPSSGANDVWSGLVRLHAAGTIMDDGAVEFAVGNPSWLRRIFFALAETEPAKIRQRFGFYRGRGYGYPRPVQHAPLVGADLTLDLGRSWGFEGGIDGDQIASLGAVWVAKQLVAIGCLEEDQIDWDDIRQV